jgi:hypothetical protein
MASFTRKNTGSSSKSSTRSRSSNYLVAKRLERDANEDLLKGLGINVRTNAARPRKIEIEYKTKHAKEAALLEVEVANILLELDTILHHLKNDYKKASEKKKEEIKRDIDELTQTIESLADEDKPKEAILVFYRRSVIPRWNAKIGVKGGSRRMRVTRRVRVKRSTRRRRRV